MSASRRPRTNTAELNELSAHRGTVVDSDEMLVRRGKEGARVLVWVWPSSAPRGFLRCRRLVFADRSLETIRHD